MKRIPVWCLLLLAPSWLCFHAVGADHGDAITPALAHEDRPQDDRDVDANRRPDAVLEFFGLRRGMSVLDMFSSTGYYTEIVSRVVGPSGRVLAHNNKAYRDYAAAGIAARYADGRLPNVSRLDVEVKDLNLEPGSLDLALMVLAYHDLYYEPGDGSWPDIDGPAMLREIYAGLRSGGVLGLVDHEARPGAPLVATGTTLHRIDKRVVLEQIEAAGFVLDAESDLLDNPEDDLTQSAFADGLRGKTDRFVFRFRKP